MIIQGRLASEESSWQSKRVKQRREESFWQEVQKVQITRVVRERDKLKGL